MYNNNDAVATNIRNARLKKNYTQDYLGYKLNISQNAYSKVELGYTQLTFDRLIEIAKILEVDLKALIGTADIQADVDAISRIPMVPKLLEVVCRTTGMGFAAIARVTEDKWVACGVRDEIAFGLTPGDELKLETTICNEIRQSGKEVVIDHVADDKCFAGHPTPAMYGFQSYISMPIIRQDGNFFGTLCAIDPRPAKLNNPETIGMFKLFADLISFHLNSIDQVSSSEIKLLEERQAAELREQFIAVLGHDLRNPIGAVLSSAQLLLHMSGDDRSKRVAKIIQDSAFRMLGLIENILDFARGRLGEGITLNYSTSEALADTLTHVVTELQTIWPEKVFEVSIHLPKPVNCDSRRIAQLFSNLLSNAITHGKKDTPVRVKVSTDDKNFKLSVTNEGKEIPAAAMERLFQPFSRVEVKPAQDGLGLGLYISSEIARAHGGTLEVSSTNKETCFKFSMPLS